MPAETTGYIENGKLHVYNREKWHQSVLLLAKKRNKRTYIKLVAERQYKQRTSPQNRYYYGVIIGITADYIENNHLFDHEVTNDNGITETIHHDINETRELLHFQLKMRFLYQELTNPDTGEIDRVPLSTKNLPTIKFEEYAENCRRFILEWYKINLPLPNEQADLFMENL